MYLLLEVEGEIILEVLDTFSSYNNAKDRAFHGI